MANTLRKQNKEVSSFTNGSLLKAMLVFVGPYMLGILLQNLYGAVDLLVVGQFAETKDVSAVTIGSQLMSLVTQLIIGFATGITVLIGHYYGAKDKKSMTKITGTSVVFFSILGILLTAIYIIFNNPIISVMHTPQAAVGATRNYLIVCSIGIIFIVGFNVLSNIMIGLGDSKTPFIFIMIACIINVVLDIVLVKYFHLGALGAGIATTIAQMGSFIFSIIFLRKKGLGYPFKKNDIKVHNEYLMRVFKIGGPVAVQNMAVSISFLFITSIINKMGLVASASVGVVEKLIIFMFVPVTSIGVAVSTGASQNLGANQGKRAYKCMWYGIIISLMISSVLLVVSQLEGEFLAHIFTSDMEVVKLGNKYLKSYSYDIIMVSFVFCLNGYFNSCDKSWFSLLHSMIATFLVRVPLSFIFSRMENTSLYLIGWAAPISTLLSIVLCFSFLYIIRRKSSYESICENGEVKSISGKRLKK